MSCWIYRATGKGTLEAKVMGRVDIITGTLNFRWSNGRLYYSQKIKIELCVNVQDPICFQIH
jgi:hypothetical protein